MPNPAQDAKVEAVALHDLRRANEERQAVWCPDQVPDLSFRAVELAGEVGEACNVIKKLERERLGWRGSRDTVAHLAEELADVVICADLCAMSAGIDLGAAVVAKFNATSEKVGLPTRLAALTASEQSGREVEPVEAQVEKLRAKHPNGFCPDCGQPKEHCCSRYAHPPAFPSPELVDAEREFGIYIASKSHHFARSQALREAGAPIISTWIDEGEVGATSDFSDLWVRCVSEAASASALIAYGEPGETLKGALVEIGAALAAGKPVYLVGEIPGTFDNHPLARRAASVEEAAARASAEEGR
jgi:NTP pyrophosphatase (non-canonical NTP hydrolase)